MQAPTSTLPPPAHAEVVQRTREWLEKAVIGLNLCPFAKAVHQRGQIHYIVSDAQTPTELLGALRAALLELHAADPAVVDTSLLIHPQVLTDFLDFNDFQDLVDSLIDELRLDGVLQVASFHPQFQFAGTAPDDAENYTNRAPYPTLHLLREASIERAVAAFPDAADIYKRNIETLESLGVKGWERLWGHPSPK